MKFKIAVCMYGQPRTWKYCAPWIKEAFAPVVMARGKFSKISSFNALTHTELTSSAADIDVDYFGHIKDYNTSANMGCKGVERIATSQLDELVAAYDFTAHEVVTLEEEQNTVGRDGDWHFSPMFSSIVGSNRLKMEHEARCGVVYDLVVFHRFDTLTGPAPQTYLTNLLSRPIEPLSVYTTTHQDFRMYLEMWKHGFDDMVLSCDSLTADLVSGWFSRTYENAVEFNEVDYRIGPNVTISKCMHQSSIQRRHVPAELAIVRANADLTIPVRESFKYNQEFWVTNHASRK